MRFLLPTGGNHNGFGTLVSPFKSGIPITIKKGIPWACDNNAYTKGFQATKLIEYLERLIPHRKTCMFVVVPDSVGNWCETNDRFRWVAWKIKALEYPIAYVAQDGCENQHWPPSFDVLFVGGTTEWKLSENAIWCIKKAQRMKRGIHIGRINTWKRYKHFRLLEGSEEFTCDGTKIRYERKKTLNEWSCYEKQKKLFSI